MISTTGVTRGLWFISNPIEGVTPNERVLGSLSVCEHLPAVSRITCPNLIWSLHKCTLSTPGLDYTRFANERITPSLLIEAIRELG